MRGARGPRVTVVPAVPLAPRDLLVHRDKQVQKEMRVSKGQLGQLGRKESLALQALQDPWVHLVQMVLMDQRGR